MGWRLSRFAVVGTVTALGVAVSMRFAGAITSADNLENGAALSAFGFTAIFPAVLAMLMLRPATFRNRETVLMRWSVALQMLLIIALPRWGLYLLLGLPVAFLVVEIFETKLPRTFTDFASAPFVER